MNATRARRALAEGLGTRLLVIVVVGSGIMAQRLPPHDAGLQLLENSLAAALGLDVLILMLGPVSGAYFNPAVWATPPQPLATAEDSTDLVAAPPRTSARSRS